MGRGGWEMLEISRTNARPFDPVVTLINPKPFPKVLLKGTRLDGEEVNLFVNFAAFPVSLILFPFVTISGHTGSCSCKTNFVRIYGKLLESCLPRATS